MGMRGKKRPKITKLQSRMIDDLVKEDFIKQIRAAWDDGARQIIAGKFPPTIEFL